MKGLGKIVFWIAAIGSILFTLFYISLHARVAARGAANTKPSERPVTALALPEFSLLDAGGKPVVLADLRGRVWIANCVFTRCPGPCARMTKEMAGLHATLADVGGAVGFLSVSVDPTHDTPEILKAYADKAGADSRRWWFLTGQKPAVHDFIQKGLRLPIEELSPEEAGPDGPIVHSTKFILIDRDSNIHGYYEGFDEKSRADLVRDARKLASS